MVLHLFFVMYIFLGLKRALCNITQIFLVCIWESQVFLSSYNLFHLSFNILLNMWDKTEFPFSHIFFSTLINNSVISFQSKSLRYLNGDSVTILLARVSVWGVFFFAISSLAIFGCRRYEVRLVWPQGAIRTKLEESMVVLWND